MVEKDLCLFIFLLIGYEYTSSYNEGIRRHRGDCTWAFFLFSSSNGMVLCGHYMQIRSKGRAAKRLCEINGSCFCFASQQIRQSDNKYKE